MYQLMELWMLFRKGFGSLLPSNPTDNYGGAVTTELNCIVKSNL